MLSFTTIAKTSQDVIFWAYNSSCNRKWLMDYTDGEGDRIILKEMRGRICSKVLGTADFRLLKTKYSKMALVV